MSYEIELTNQAVDDIKRFKRSTWSRGINDKHRLIYRIEDSKVVVLVLSLYGYYGDK